MTRMLTTSMGTVTLRPTRPEDAPAFRELRLEALWMHPEAFASDHAENAARPMEWWVERMRAGAGEGNQITFVAEAPDGQLIAMCGLFREDGPKVRHTAHLWGVYVRPGWRGLKIADALIEACEIWARGTGVRAMRLAVVTTNTAAIHCYVRRGFTACGTAPEAIHADGHYYDEILMAKLLAGDDAENDREVASAGHIRANWH